VSRSWVAKSFTNYGPNKHRSCHWVVSHLRITAFYAKQTAPKSRPPKLPHHDNKRINTIPPPLPPHFPLLSQAVQEPCFP